MIPSNFNPAFCPWNSIVCTNCGLTQAHHWLLRTGCNHFQSSGKRRVAFISAACGFQGPAPTEESIAQEKKYQNELNSLPLEEKANSIRWRMEKDIPEEDDFKIYTLIGSDSFGNDLCAIQTFETRTIDGEPMMCSPNLYFISPDFVKDEAKRKEYCVCRETLLLMRQLEREYVSYARAL